MKIDETVYNEYANWKLENEELLKELETSAEDIFFRFKHIIDVIAYFYDKLIDDADYDTEDDLIFKTGFYYVADQIEELKILLKDVYNNDIVTAAKYFKEVNLYFNTLDFQSELINQEIDENEDIQTLLVFDKKVYKFLEDKESIPTEVYEELDSLTSNIYQKLNTNYYSINNIFLEIADELDIL